ncbi:MAG: NAD(P)-binding domain-containing protein, partial [bacterium]|nr:NAD(P)-binding domain-containing protein [bacterium]
MLPDKIKVGIIGCGTIGSKLARIIEKEIAEMEICAFCDIQEAKALKLSKEFSRDIKIMSIENLIDKMDMVIEAASS